MVLAAPVRAIIPLPPPNPDWWPVLADDRDAGACRELEPVIELARAIALSTAVVILARQGA